MRRRVASLAAVQGGRGYLEDKPGVHEGVPGVHILPQAVIHLHQVLVGLEGIMSRKLPKAQHPSLKQDHIHRPLQGLPGAGVCPVPLPTVGSFVVLWDAHLRPTSPCLLQCLQGVLPQLQIMRARIPTHLEQPVVWKLLQIARPVCSCIDPTSPVLRSQRLQRGFPAVDVGGHYTPALENLMVCVNPCLWPVVNGDCLFAVWIFCA